MFEGRIFGLLTCLCPCMLECSCRLCGRCVPIFGMCICSGYTWYMHACVMNKSHQVSIRIQEKINNVLSGPLQDLVAPLEMAVLCSVATLWLLKFCVPGRGWNKLLTWERRILAAQKKHNWCLFLWVFDASTCCEWKLCFPRNESDKQFVSCMDGIPYTYNAVTCTYRSILCALPCVVYTVYTHVFLCYLLGAARSIQGKLYWSLAWCLGLAGVAFRVFNDFAHMGPWEGSDQTSPKPKEIPKQKVLVKGKGLSSRGMWVRS